MIHCTEPCITRINPNFFFAVLVFYFWFVTIFVPLLILIVVIHKAEMILYAYHALLVLRPALQKYFWCKYYFAKQQFGQRSSRSVFKRTQSLRRRRQFPCKMKKFKFFRKSKKTQLKAKILAIFRKLYKKDK